MTNSDNGLRSSNALTDDALRKTVALQNAILNSVNFSSIATDAKGVIQIFNVGAERMLGYSAAEVMNTITPADISDPQEPIARASALSAELATPRHQHIHPRQAQFLPHLHFLHRIAKVGKAGLFRHRRDASRGCTSLPNCAENGRFSDLP